MMHCKKRERTTRRSECHTHSIVLYVFKFYRARVYLLLLLLPLTLLVSEGGVLLFILYSLYIFSSERALKMGT